MNTYQMNYFLTTADCMNVTMAAEKLHMTQSALSKSISALEKELNAKLFIRSGRKILSMTLEGAEVYRQLDGIYKEYQGMVEKIKITQDGSKRKNVCRLQQESSRKENFMGEINYQPLRSLIYVDCVREEYRHKLQHWLYYYHIPESIAKFEPWVTKYSFYNALPTPPEGERFGTYRMQLTEHYWMVNPMCQEGLINALNEYFPKEALIWQGTIPDTDTDNGIMASGDAARRSGGDNGCPPFVFVFLPIFWETDLKGMGRTMVDGPNYRWQFLISYPDDKKKEGEQWMMEEILPAFAEMPEVTRILTSKVKKEINGSHMDRCVEMWFDGPEEWYQCAVVKAKEFQKPAWAECEQFPYLRPQYKFASLFLTDIATSDNLKQYRGYLPLR